MIQFLLLLLGALLSSVLSSASSFQIDVFSSFRYFGKNRHLCRGDFSKTTGNKNKVFLAVEFVVKAPDTKCREKRDMIGQDTKFAIDAGSADIIDLFLEHHLVWCHYFKRNCFSHINTPEQELLFLGVFQCLVKSAYHVEAGLRNGIVLALDDFLEALDGLFELHIAAFLAGELGCNEERL